MTTIRPLGAAVAGAALLLSLQAPLAARAAGSDGTHTRTKGPVQGNTQGSPADLQAALPVQPGQTIDQAGMQRDVDAVQALYGARNVGVTINARLPVMHKTQAVLVFELAEQAPQAPIVRHVGVTADTVSVTGNSKVSTADILAAANIKPGQVVTNPEITAAQAAIVALYKKNNVGVVVNTDWTDVSPQHVAMVFKITEKDDG